MPWSSLRRFNFSKLLPRRAPSILAVLSFLILVTVGLSVWIEPTQAQFTEIGNALIRAVTYIIFALSTLFIKITIFFLQLFILIAGYNNYINAPVVLLGWNMIRDVANMFFVVVLLVIAFGTILGLEQYEWRKSLVKLVLAAVLVNFSNLICQVIIDIAQVFTTTFLNAIIGTAGGNLINMFNFQQIYQITTGQNYEGLFTQDTLMLNVFIASVIALVFAGTAMWTIGAYLIVMVARLVVLWTLIILSPLAFLFSVLPQTKSYADEIWSQFTKHVIVAPVMVFFLWLSFATFGGGTVVQDAIEGPKNNSTNKTVAGAVDQDGHPVTAGINDAASYDRMANFIVAVAFLWIGIEQVQKLGVRAGGLTSGAIDFAKKTATIASGYAAGRWLVGGARDLGVRAGKGAAYNMPLFGGKEWATRAKITGQAVRGWYYGKGTEKTAEGDRLAKDLSELHQQLSEATPEGRKALEEKIAQTQAEKNRLEALSQDGSLSEEEKKSVSSNLEQATKTEAELQGRLKTATIRSREEIKQEIATKEELLKKEVGGGLVGFAARRGAALEKQAGRVATQADNRRSLLFKRTSAEGQSGLLGITSIGAGSGGIGWGKKYGGGQKGGRFRFFGDVNAGIYGQDRIEEGWLQAEEARSRMKDFEYQNQGRRQALSASRWKAEGGKFEVQFKRGSVQDQIELHKMVGEEHESEIGIGELKARQRLIDRAMNTIKNIDKDPEVAKLNETISRLGEKLTGLSSFTRSISNANANGEDAAKTQKAKGEKEEEIKRLQESLGGMTSRTDRARVQEQIRAAQAERDLLAEKFDQFSADAAQALKEANETKQKFAIDISTENVVEALKQAQDQLVAVSEEKDHLQHESTEVFDKAVTRMWDAAQSDDKGKLAAWVTARAGAKKSHEDNFFGGIQRNISDEAAQKHIWDHEGIETPSTAFVESVDHVLAEFKDMDLPRVVDAVKGFGSYLSRQKRQGKSMGHKDRIISNALLHKLESQKIIDDAITPFVKMMRESLGKDGEKLQAQLVRREATRVVTSGDTKSLNDGQIAALGNVLKKILPDQVGSILDGFKTTGAATAGADLDAALRSVADSLKGLKLPELSAAGLPHDLTKLGQAISGLVKGLKPEDLSKLRGKV